MKMILIAEDEMERSMLKMKTHIEAKTYLNTSGIEIYLTSLAHNRLKVYDGEDHLLYMAVKDNENSST